MKNTIIKFTLALAAITIMSCSTNSESSSAYSGMEELETAKEELKGVVSNMWENISSVSDYFNADVFENLSSINDKGIVESKEVLRADSKQTEMLEMLAIKFFDQQHKVFDKVVITNGRIHAYAGEAYVGEVFYPSMHLSHRNDEVYQNVEGAWTKR